MNIDIFVFLMSTFKSLKFNQMPLVGFIREMKGLKRGGGLIGFGILKIDGNNTKFQLY